MVTKQLISMIIEKRDRLNGQYFSWADVKARVLQGSVQIFISNLSGNFFSNPKLFPGDTYLMSVLREIIYLQLI